MANYDLLRIACTLAVIMIHVSAIYQMAWIDEGFPGIRCDRHVLVAVLCQTMTRFAVPCFLMLSGAFLLHDSRNGDPLFFYRKAITHIGIPTGIFSLLYLLYSLARVLLRVIVRGQSMTLLWTPVKNFLMGAPFYHMWYLFTLAGIYVLVPFIVRLKNGMGEKTFARASWAYFFVACASGFTSSFRLHWSVSAVACFLGYVLVGGQIRRVAVRKSNARGVLLVVLALALLFALSFLQYHRTLAMIGGNAQKLPQPGSFHPIVAMASILLFGGFSLLEIKTAKLAPLARSTFLIYLIHAGIWNLAFDILFHAIGGLPSPVSMIPLGITTVFLVSWGLSRVYEKAWNAIDGKHAVSARICRLLGL